MTLILLASRLFAAFGTRHVVNVMRHHIAFFMPCRSMFRGRFSTAWWTSMERLAGATARHEQPVPGASVRPTVGADSLRAIEAGLQSHAGRSITWAAAAWRARRWPTPCPTARGAVWRTVRLHGDARRPRDAAQPQGCGAYPRRHEHRASSLSGGWLDTVSGHRAVKLHVCYDPVAAAPLRADLSDQRVNDITPAKAVPIDAVMTCVFDPAITTSPGGPSSTRKAAASSAG